MQDMPSLTAAPMEVPPSHNNNNNKCKTTKEALSSPLSVVESPLEDIEMSTSSSSSNSPLLLLSASSPSQQQQDPSFYFSLYGPPVGGGEQQHHQQQQQQQQQQQPDLEQGAIPDGRLQQPLTSTYSERYRAGEVGDTTNTGRFLMNRERFLSDPADLLAFQDDGDDAFDANDDWYNRDNDLPSYSTSTTESVSSFAHSSSAATNTAAPTDRRRHRSNRPSPYGLTEVPEGASGLRASLDAGMLAVRRWWIRNTPNHHHHQHNNNNNHPSFHERNNVHDYYASTWQQQHRQLQHHPLVSPQRLRERTQSEPDPTRIRQFLPQIRHRRRHRPELSSRAAAALLPSDRLIGGNNNNITTRARTNSTGPARSTENNPTNHSSSSAAQQPLGRAAMSAAESSSQQQQQAPPSSSSSSQQQQQQQQQVPSAHSMIVMPGGDTSNAATATGNRLSAGPALSDPERRARVRWIRINRRFQLVITIVALLFSLLLFAILISWVVLTSSYVVSFDKSCDVPLKPYFWLVTFQLVLDVFRSDIMRFVFHWDANSNQRIPCRVVAYNLAYLLYAMLVLRLGINAVFVQDDTTCRNTAPELFNASAAFISLSMAAWATILCGYLLPFCIVAAMLTCNGYNPASASPQWEGPAQPVFPAAYTNTGAPSGCIEMLPVVSTNDFPPHYPRECCICMEEFSRRTDVVVETACKHVFHKQCCREWLLQARSCPVCRTDIPSNMERASSESHNNVDNDDDDDDSLTPVRQIPIGPTGRPVAGLLRMLHHPSESSSLVHAGGAAGGAFRGRSRTASTGSVTNNNGGVSSSNNTTPLRARSLSVNLPESSSTPQGR